MTHDNQRCAVCGLNAAFVVTESRIVVAVDGTKLSIEDEFTRCALCGDEFYTYNQSLAASRAYVDARREHAERNNTE